MNEKIVYFQECYGCEKRIYDDEALNHYILKITTSRSAKTDIKKFPVHPNNSCLVRAKDRVVELVGGNGVGILENIVVDKINRFLNE